MNDRIKKIFIVNTKAAGATIEQAAKAMVKTVNIPYIPEKIEGEYKGEGIKVPIEFILKD